MSSKSNKTPQTVWSCCNNCNAYILTKEKDNHVGQCPVPQSNWNQSFILNEKLFSFVEIKSKDAIQGLPSQDIHNFIFLSQSAIQLCNFKIGDPVVVIVENQTPIVRTLWPTIEKKSASVMFTENAIQAAWEKLLTKHVRIEALPQKILKAKLITITTKKNLKNLDIHADLCKRLQRMHINKILCNGNRLSVLYYGKIIEFIISNIDFEKSEDNLCNELEKISFDSIQNQSQLFQVVENTKFIISNFSVSKNVKPKSSITLGGLSKIEQKVLLFIDTYFSKKFNKSSIVKSVLLYGYSGTGKTSLANLIANKSEIKYNTNIYLISCFSICSQTQDDSDDKLNNLFKEAIDNSPSVVILDDLNILCPVKSSKPSEKEKRVTASVIKFLDSIIENEFDIFVIATSNNIDAIDSSLRRFGRIDFEIEISVPNELARKEILTNLLKNFTNLEIDELVSITPGYVGSDLMLVYATATNYAHFNARTVPSLQDFILALKEVKPSAMREVQIESPNVNWSDIGGQNDLKLKLKQAIEWPIIHPESFTRMGIRPPRGLLMYGPPGCSKTMIAKAIASETKLNFLSIKGPELFNKYVGESERAVRDLFRRARQAAPSIIFFDEIDAIGGERSTSGGNSGSVQERVLAQLLTELDGVTALGAVTVVAATNRPDRIDKALLRPGRLDRIVYVPLPDAQTRLAIVTIKTAKMPVEELDFQYLVDKTEGYSGAEVQAVCNEAAMKALEEDILSNKIEMRHFEHALNLIKPRTSKSLIEMYEKYSISH